MSEDAIRSYLGRKEDFLLEKHLYMLCQILGMDVPDEDKDNGKDVTGEGGTQELFTPKGRLDAVMQKNLAIKNSCYFA